ncbi:Haloacid dehalogenase domain protein hydrolase [[Leptolyngbya] sp. PCC 7376]|uniref:HAD family hydrolase n=1 Tax=[Leptolyngbya] sp. PCC 7376 TaxID=111781 RepID=UPI00029EFF92|nr:HAD hydrolase-like protein [[Leptolyngbya] sp. PCC 7376]AFY40068.1 Haloacid dehalogenase domain protein hydrolase [[Leptolyngbya] sp. PCC 7376]
MRLILDFDGVIADLSERYYRVYRWSLTEIATPEQTITPLSKTDFWQLERLKTTRPEIALKSGLTNSQTKQYIQLRKENAHALKNMIHDRIIDGSLQALQIAKSLGWEIMTVTMRRHSELAEVIRLNPRLEEFFPGDRRFTKPEEAEHDRDLNQKPLLLKTTLASLSPAESTWMVGDTEADIRAAQTCNIPVIAVLSGIRDRQILEDFRPDYIANDLLEAVTLIQTKL